MASITYLIDPTYEAWGRNENGNWIKTTTEDDQKMMVDMNLKCKQQIESIVNNKHFNVKKA